MKKEAFLKGALVLIILIALGTSLLAFNIQPLRDAAKSVRDSVNPYFPIGPLVGTRNPAEIPFPHKNNAVIFIHDVAPEYEPYVKQITDIISKYNFQKYTYLFLITYHHGEYNMENYPKYITFLKTLQNEGFHIEFHAYLHNGAEFNCSYKTAISKLKKSEGILERCGFKNINLFYPPHGKVSKEAIKAFLERGISVITKRTLLVPQENKIRAFVIDNQEFSWYINEKTLPQKIKKAENNYRMAKKRKRTILPVSSPKSG